ncbi:hypothetical protein [Vibrio maritimus]|uniref:hypothetical protein n=1 Tax=Vibrio maritimus TaxID=990268 RepID=UPI003735C057
MVCSSYPNSEDALADCQHVNARITRFPKSHQLEVALSYSTSFQTHLTNPDIAAAGEPFDLPRKVWLLSDEVVIEYQLNRAPFIAALE